MNRISARDLRVAGGLSWRKRINKITEVEVHRVCFTGIKEFNLGGVKAHFGSGENYISLNY